MWILSKWHGPYDVTWQVEDVDYNVKQNDRGRVQETCHLNLLNLWNELIPVALAMVVPEREEQGLAASPKVATQSILVHCRDDLSPSQLAEFAKLQTEFPDVFSPLPSHRHLIQHQIEMHPGAVSTQLPLVPTWAQEKCSLSWALGHAEHGNNQGVVQTDWSSLVVLVHKPIRSVWFCVDFWRVNAVSKFDSPWLLSYEKKWPFPLCLVYTNMSPFCLGYSGPLQHFSGSWTESSTRTSPKLWPI